MMIYVQRGRYVVPVHPPCMLLYVSSRMCNACTYMYHMIPGSAEAILCAIGAASYITSYIVHTLSMASCYMQIRTAPTLVHRTISPRSPPHPEESITCSVMP